MDFKKILGVYFFWNAFVAFFLPITQDEAYYLSWGRSLDWGYFDHPPLVALLGKLGEYVHPRWAVVITSTYFSIVLYKLYELFCLKKETLFIALILSLFNLAGVISGFLLTPDIVLMAMTASALLFAAYGLTKNPIWWLLAGFFSGLALLSKYTAVLLLPVFFIGIFWGNRKQMSSCWPYLGALVALSVFLPHLYWQSTNRWPTFTFQLQHGLKVNSGQIMDSTLPVPLKREKNGMEEKLANPFLEEEKKEHKQTTAKDKIVSKLEHLWPIFDWFSHTSSFFVSQIAFLGGFLILLFFAYFRNRKRQLTKDMNQALKPLFIAQAILPLLFFLAISFQNKVEANWSLSYLLGACPLLAFYFQLQKRWVYFVSGVHILLLTFALLHTRYPVLPIPFSKDRLLQETFGYEALAKRFSNYSEPLFADSYQLVSLLLYYNRKETSLVYQWPGITRPSEFLRNRNFSNLGYEKLTEIGRFSLLTSEKIPPRIKGFEPYSLEQIKDCPNKNGLTSVSSEKMEASSEREKNEANCDSIHTWYLARYRLLTFR